MNGRTQPAQTTRFCAFVNFRNPSLIAVDIPYFFSPNAKKLKFYAHWLYIFLFQCSHLERYWECLLLWLLSAYLGLSKSEESIRENTLVSQTRLQDLSTSDMRKYPEFCKSCFAIRQICLDLPLVQSRTKRKDASRTDQSRDTKPNLFLRILFDNSGYYRRRSA